MSFPGVHVAVITPFRLDDTLDIDAYERHLTWLSQNGVHGIVACGTTGEGSTLTNEERRMVLEKTRELCTRLELRFIVGAGTNSTATTIERVQEAKRFGAEAALVVTPYYNKPTQAGLSAHFKEVAEKGGLPILLYNVPGRTGVSLTPATTAELLRHPGIVGLKDASGQHTQWLNLAAATDFSKVSILSGDDDAFAFILALGGKGIISASANVAPLQFVKIYELATAGRWTEAFALQTKLQPLVRALFSETNPAPAKAALHRLGRCADRLRLPLVSVAESTRKEIEGALKGLELEG